MINVRGKDMLLIEAHGHVWTGINGRRFVDCTNTPIGFGRTQIGDDVVQFLPPEFFDCSCPIGYFETWSEILGTDKAVLLQTPCYGEQYEYVNEILAKNPGKYVSVGIGDVSSKENYIAAAKLCMDDYGYKGMKFEPPDVPFDMVDPNNAYIYEEIIKRDKFFMCDLGWGRSKYDYQIDNMLEIAKRYPDMKIILPHLGISHMWDPEEYKCGLPTLKKTLSILEYNKNVYFDCSGIPMMVHEFDEYPYPTMEHVIYTVKAEGALDHLMWGTDMPTVLVACTYQQHLTCVTNHCEFLTDDEMENLLGKTADKVWFGK